MKLKFKLKRQMEKEINKNEVKMDGDPNKRRKI